MPGGLRRLQSGWDERSSSGGFDSRPPPPTICRSGAVSTDETHRLVTEWSRLRDLTARSDADRRSRSVDQLLHSQLISLVCRAMRMRAAVALQAHPKTESSISSRQLWNSVRRRAKVASSTSNALRGRSSSTPNASRNTARLKPRSFAAASASSVRRVK